MPFTVPINILDFIFKGMMIGVIASAPMGPVGILCVQRTLNKGRWYGFVLDIQQLRDEEDCIAYFCEIHQTTLVVDMG